MILSTIFILFLAALGCFLLAAALEARECAKTFPPAREWRSCEYNRVSVVSHCYNAGWTSDELHAAADDAFYDGNLDLRDTLRAAAQAVEIRERVEAWERRQLSPVRAQVRVRIQGVGA